MTPRRLPAALPLVLLVVLTSMNLRPVASTIGPLLPELQADLGMNGAVSGLLTSLPPLCFALFGPLAPALSRRFGQMTVIMAGMGLLAVGLVVRALTDQAWVFLLCSTLAVAGVAVGNVLMPAVVGHAFPGRIERMTAMYSIVLTAAATLAAASAVPLAAALGSWRWALGIWAVLAVAALLSAARNRVSQPPRSSVPRLLPPLRRSRIARGMAAYMAVNATTAYVVVGWLPQIFRDAGISASTSGLMLAVVLGLAAPIALFLPGLIARLPDQRPLVWVFCLSALVAYAGLLLAPAALAWPCAILLGLNGAGFPLALTMIGLRARTQEGVTRLSSFTQGMGYLLAIPGPVLIGVVYEHSGGWDLPIAFLAVILVPQLALGLHAARRGTIEDEFAERRKDGAPDVSVRV